MPIITGTNRDEMKLFQILDPAYTRRFFGTLVQAKDPEMYQATSDYQSRLWRVRAVDWPADQMAGAGHTEVYAYRFDWDDAGSILFSDFEFLFGATHSVEIPFITGDFEFFGPLDRFLFRKSNEADRLALSATMMAYWASFARDGKPSAPGEADWQAYTEGPAPFVLRLDAPSDGGVEAIKEGDSFERLFTDLRGDSGLSSDEQCQIVDGMAVWVPQEEAQYKELSSC
ncbi:MAG: carboxylesterase family protein [Pseudomonadota bacterium]